MKSSSNVRPSTFEKVGNGSWFYNYHIVERTERDPESGEERTVFDYDQIQVWEKPNDDVLKEAVIANKYTLEEEINLQNNYRRFELKMSKVKSFETDYIEYLKDVDALKQMVDQDLVEHASEII